MKGYSKLWSILVPIFFLLSLAGTLFDDSGFSFFGFSPTPSEMSGSGWTIVSIDSLFSSTGNETSSNESDEALPPPEENSSVSGEVPVYPDVPGAIPIEDLVDGVAPPSSQAGSRSACDRMGLDSAYCVDKEERILVADLKNTEVSLGKVSLNKSESFFDEGKREYKVVNTRLFLKNLTNVVFRDTEFVADDGSVYFESLRMSVLAETDLSNVIIIKHNFIGIDSEEYPEFSQPAHLTFTGMQGYAGAQPLRNGEPCGPDYCSNFTYNLSSGIFEMDVSGFSNYSYGSDANLTVYTEYDGYNYYPIDVNIWFYANYTNNSAHITGATCNLTLDNGTSYIMADTGSQYSHQVWYAYTTLGDHSYTIECNKTGYDTLNASEYFEVVYQVKSCITITKAGKHVLFNNLSGADQPTSPTVNYACIAFKTKYAELDCNGYNITNNGTADAAGIIINYTDYESNNITNCPAISGYLIGVFIRGTHDIILRNSTVFEATVGIDAVYSKNILIDRVTVHHANDYGIYFNENDYSNITNSNVSSSEWGIKVKTSNNTNVVNTIFSNNDIDLEVECLTSDPRLFELTASSFLNDDGTYENYTNLSLQETMGVQVIKVDWAEDPGTYPANTGSFEHKFLNITTTSDTDIDKIVWHWNNNELAGYNENSFAIWKYSPASNSWFFLPFSQNLGYNEIMLSKYEANGIYGILENSSCSKLEVPGEYILTSNVSGAFTPGDVTGYNNVCFKLVASDIELDCNGYILRNDGKENGTAFIVESSDYTNATIDGCDIFDYKAGVMLYNTKEHTILNSNFRNGTHGIYIYASNDSEADHVTMEGMSSAGIRLSHESTNNTISDATVSSSGMGIYVYGSARTVLNRPVLYNNSYDIYSHNPVSSYVFHVYNATFTNPLGTSLNQTILSFADEVEADEEYFLNWTSEPFTPTVGLRSFAGKYVKIENVSASATLSTILWRWTDAESAGYDEDKFRLWMYSDGSWGMVPGATLDTSENTIEVTLLPLHSDYGIMETNTSSCMLINQPGEYVFDRNIKGATIPVSNPQLSNACFVIESSDVILDCNGFNLTNTGVSTAAGVFINGTSDSEDLINITLANCANISGYSVGAYFYNTSYNLLHTSNFTNNSVSAAFSNCLDTDIENITSSNSSIGFYSVYAETSLAGSTIHSSTDKGIYLRNCDSRDTNILRSTLYGNNLDVVINQSSAPVFTMDVTMEDVLFLNPYGTLENYTNLSLYDSIAAAGAYSVKWAENPGSVPSYSRVFNEKFLNITNISGTVSIDEIVWTWTDAEAVGYNEEALEVWRYNSSGSWNSIGSVLNIYANTLTTEDLSPSSIYGLFETNQTTSQCFVADTPNMYYELTQDLEGAPFNHTSIYHGNSTACIVINTSNVTIDCNGYKITNNGTTGHTYGIVTNTLLNATLGQNLENINLLNCDVSGYSIGISFQGDYFVIGSINIQTYIKDSLIRNSTGFNNSEHGLHFFRVMDTIVNKSAFYNNTNGSHWTSSIRNAFANSTLYNNIEYGGYLTSGYPTLSHNNTFVFMQIHDNKNGIRVDGADDTNVWISVFENHTQTGLSLYYTDYGGMRYLNFTNTTGAHIYMNTSQQNRIRDVIGLDSAHGAYLDEGSNYNIFNNTYITDCTYGTYFFDAHNNTLGYSDISEYMYGIYLHESNGNQFDNVSTVNGSRTGITLMASAQTRMDNIESSNNSWYGIALFERESEYNNFTYGAIHNNSIHGILVDQAPHNRFTFLEIFNNTLMGYLSDGADYNFIGNSQFAYHGTAGVYLNDTSSHNYVAKTSSDWSTTGFFTYSSGNNRFEDVNASNHSLNGFRFEESDNINLTRALAYNSSMYGISLVTSEYVSIQWANVTNYAYGITVWSLSYNSSINHTVVYNGQYGVSVDYGDDFIFQNLTVYNNTHYGLNSFGTVGGLAVGSAFHDNGQRGVYLVDSLDLRFWLCDIYNNGIYGMECKDSAPSQSQPILIDNVRFWNNSFALVFNNTDTRTYHNITSSYFLPKSGEIENYTRFSSYDAFLEYPAAYGINWSDEPAPPNPYYVSFRQKYLNITAFNDSTTVNDMTWHWTNAETIGYEEDYFVLMRYNPGGIYNWSVPIGPTLNTAANRIYWEDVPVPFASGDNDVYGIFQNNGSFCRIFDSPGSHTMVSNVSGASVDISEPHFSLQHACIVINTSDFTLDCAGYSILNEGLGFAEDDAVGVWISGSSSVNHTNVTVKNCEHIYNYSIGAYAMETAEDRFEDIYIHDSQSINLEVYESFDINITNVTAFYADTYYGIGLDAGSERVRIEDCELAGNTIGISLSGSSNNTIYDNELRYSHQVGVYVNAGSNSNNITENNIWSNGFTGAYFSGVYVSTSDSNTFWNNSIHHNGRSGIELYDSNSNEFFYNLVYNNLVNGLRMLDCTGASPNYFIGDSYYNNSHSGANISNSVYPAIFDKAIFENNSIAGIYVADSSYVTFLSYYPAFSAYSGPETRVKDNGEYGAWITDSDNVAMGAYGTHSLDFTGNGFGGALGVGPAIYVYNSTSFTLGGIDPSSRVYVRGNAVGINIANPSAMTTNDYLLHVEASHNSGSALRLSKADYVSVFNSTFHHQEGIGHGINLLESDWCDFLNVSSYSNNFTGISLSSHSLSNDIQDSFIYNNRLRGLDINDAGVAIQDTVIYNHGQYDIYATNPSPFLNPISMNNVSILNPAGTWENYTSFSLLDSPYNGETFSINWTTNSSELPDDYLSFHEKWINISGHATPATIGWVIWHWTDAEVIGYDEDRLVLAKYNVSSGWTILNASPNIASNRLTYYNFKPGSDYGILQNNGSCQIINESGTYVLEKDGHGAPYDIDMEAITPINKACIIIEASNVVLDCNGYSILNDGTLDAGGIAVNGSSSERLENITIANCSGINNYEMGFTSEYSRHLALSNSSFSNSSYSAVFTAYTNNSLFTNLSTYNNTIHAVAFSYYSFFNNATDVVSREDGSCLAAGLWSENNRFDSFDCNNTLPVGYGAAYLFYANSTNVTNSVFEGYDAGVLMLDGDNSHFENITIYDSLNEGVVTDRSDYNEFRNMAIRDSPDYCFHLANSTHNEGYNLTCYDSDMYSFYLEYADYNKFEDIYSLPDSTADSGMGFYLWEDSNYNNITRLRVEDSTGYSVYLDGSSNNRIEELVSLRATLHGVQMQHESLDNVLHNSTISQSAGFGVQVQNSTATLTNNVIDDSVFYGIEVVSADVNASHNLVYGGMVGMEARTSAGFDMQTHIVGHNNTFYDASEAELVFEGNTYFLNMNLTNTTILPASGLYENYSVFDIHDIVAPSRGFTIKWASGPASFMETPYVYSYRTFNNKFLNITSDSNQTIARFVWHWDASEISGFEEEKIRMVKNAYSLGRTIFAETPDTVAHTLTFDSLQLYEVYATDNFGLFYKEPCGIINESGSYLMSENATGAPNTVSSVFEITKACIVIRSSNVDLSCEGYSVENDGTLDAAGILVQGASSTRYSNVTIQNCPNVQGYEKGIYGHYNIKSTIRNSTSRNATDSAFFLYNTNWTRVHNNTAIHSNIGFTTYVPQAAQRFTYNNFTDNIARNNTGRGFYARAYAGYGTYTNNTAYYNGGYGFDQDAIASNSNYTGNSAYNNSNYGYYLEGNNIRFLHNTAYYNTGHGIYITGIDNGNFINNTAHHNTDVGIRQYYYAQYCVFINNTAYSNGGRGFYTNDWCFYNNWTGNIAYENGDDGFYMGSGLINFINNTAYNNAMTGVWDGGGGSLYANNTMYGNGQYGYNDQTGSSVENLINNLAYNNPTGFRITTLNVNLTNNTAHSNDWGFVSIGGYDTFNNNLAYNNTNSGFHIYVGATYNYLNHNVAYNNSHGITLDGFNPSGYVNRAHHITFNNNTLYDNSVGGLYIYSSYNNIIENNTAYNNSQYGIRLYQRNGDSYNTLRNNTAKNNPIGFFIDRSRWNTLVDNFAYDNSESGFNFSTAHYNNITNNTAYNNTLHGFAFQSSNYNTEVARNKAYNNTNGFFLTSSAYNLLRENEAYENERGFYSYLCTLYNTLENNTASLSTYGFSVSSSSSQRLSNNTAYNNTQYGLHVSNSAGTNATNTHLFSNVLAALYVENTGVAAFATYFTNLSIDNPAGNFTNYTMLDIVDSVASSTAYSVNWTSVPAPLPTSRFSFRGKWINISTEVGAVSIDEVIWRWLDSEVTGYYNDTFFELWRHNEIGWFMINNTPDEAANTLKQYNLDPTSDYGILQYNGTSCIEITGPGTYILAANLTGAPNNASEVVGLDWACIKIASNNVTLDCNGKSITNTGVANAAAIVVNGSASRIYTNVTITNCLEVPGYEVGIYYHRASDSVLKDSVAYEDMIGFFAYSSTGLSFTNLTARNNSQYGFQFYSGSNNLLSNSTAWNNSQQGFYIYSSPITLYNNSAYLNTQQGFLVYGSDYSNLTRNVAYNNSEDGFVLHNSDYSNTYFADAYNNTKNGIVLSSSSFAVISNSTVHENPEYGIHVLESQNSSVANNSAYNNTGAGIAFNESEDSSAYSNLVYNNAKTGILVSSASASILLYGNLIYENFAYGVQLHGSQGTNLTNNTFYNNSVRDLLVNASGAATSYTMLNSSFLNPHGTFENYTALSGQDSASIGEEYGFSWATNTSGMPTDRRSFRNKYVNISTIAGTPSIEELIWTWLDSELSPDYFDIRFEIWNYTTSWALMNNTADPTNNLLSIYNTYPDGIYGILERGNEPPVIDWIVLNSTWDTNYTTENLTVWYEVFDAEGMPVKNITAWHVDDAIIQTAIFPFEGGSNSTFTRNYGSGGNASVHNDATWNSTGGHDGFGAYSCDGVNEYINTTVVPGATDGSVNVWFKAPVSGQLDTYGMIFGQMAASSLRLRAQVRNSDELLLWSFDGTTEQSTGVAVNDGLWHMLTITWGDGTGRARLYLDGVETHTLADDEVHVFPQGIYICNHNLNGVPEADRYFYGGVDDFQVFTRALSAEQIQMVYNNQTDSIHYRETRQDENWTACVTPNDMLVDGNTNCSNNLTIARLAVENVTLNSSLGTNTTDENLTLNYDLYNGSEQGIINWYVDDVPLLNLYFPFEAYDGEVPAIAKDYSPNSLNGTLSSAVWSPDMHGGKPGFDFDTAASYIYIADPGTGSALDSPQFTIEAWANPDVLPGAGTLNEIVSKVQSGGFGMGLADNGRAYLRVYVAGTLRYAYTSSGQIAIGNWHHITGTYDQATGELKVYVNGTLNGSSTYAGAYTPNNAPICIAEQAAAAACSDGENYNGQVSLVRFWNRTFTPEQIASLYNDSSAETIVSQETNYGENWTGCVLPNGDWEDSLNPEVCSSLQINDRIPPIIENITLNSTYGTNYTTENLTVWYDSYSPEGGEVKNITHWFVDETPVIIVDMPFENSGSSLYTRDYANGLNGTPVNNPTWGADYGFDGWGGYSYTTGSDYMNIDNIAPYIAGQTITITTWVRLDTTSAEDQYIFATNGPTGSAVNYIMFGREYNPVNRFLIFDGATNCNPGTFLFQTGQWYHVAVVLEPLNSRALAYVNGEYLGECAFAVAIPSNARVSLGQEFDTATISNEWGGRIDEFRVYNRSLSAGQIQMLFNNQTDSIHLRETRQDEVWQSCITANDRYVDGLANCSNNLTIARLAVENVTLTSSSGLNTTDDDLTLDFDLFNGSEIGIINWYLNDTSIMVLNMPFEGYSGTTPTLAKDYSPYGNNGTIVGVEWDVDGGHDGRPAYLFTAGDSISIPDSPSVNITGDQLTVSVWIKPTDFSDSSARVVVKEVPSNVNPYYRYIVQQVTTTGVMLFGISTGGSGTQRSVSLTSAVSTGSWSHIVGVYNGSELRIYYNGALNNTQTGVTGNIAATTRPLVIGADTETNDEYFHGYIDDVQVYARALSAEQIAMIYNGRTDMISANETEAGDIWKGCVLPNGDLEDSLNGEVCRNLTIIEPVEGCQIISSAGEYELTNNAIGADNYVYNVYDVSRACIIIASSDVSFSCAGYNVTNNGIPDAAGIVINGSVSGGYTNVTVMDCPGVSGYEKGIYLHNTSLDTITNSTAHNNTDIGFFAYHSISSAISSSTGYNNTYGFYAQNFNSSNLTDITANSNEGGFFSSGSYGLMIDPSYFYNNTVGINVTDTNDTVIDDSYIYNNTYGIWISGSNNTLINRSSIYNNTLYGVYQANSEYTNSTNTNITYNGVSGIYLDSNSESNTIYNNYVCFNGLDINNASDYTTGEIGTCDSWLGWAENGHPGCTYRCTDMWHTIYGDTGGYLVLAENNASVYEYRWNATGYNVYAVNTLNSPSLVWSDLLALGRNTSILNSTNDFTNMDTLLATTVYPDNVDYVYSYDGSNPYQTINREIYSQLVQYIPVANSTNYSAFLTGIMWDSSTDTDGHFSLADNETLVLVSPVNSSTSGTYGTYDYEMRIPATFDTYVPGSTTVDIYLELV